MVTVGGNLRRNGTDRAIVKMLGLAALGWLATVGLTARAAPADAGTRADGSTDAAAAPWQAQAEAAASEETRRRDAVERQAQQQCAPLVNMANYDAQRRSPGASSSREAADNCLAGARHAFRQRADAEARSAAFFDQQRAAAQQADAQRQAARAREREKQRAEERAEADQEAAEQRELAARAKDPAFRSARLSFLGCYWASRRKVAKQKIDDERQGARAGLGVIDLRTVHDWQEEIVIMSKLEALTRGEIGTKKAAPLSCKSEDAQKFNDCIADARSDTLVLGPGDDEYLEDAKRIFEGSASCTPWKRLTSPAAPVGASAEPPSAK